MPRRLVPIILLAVAATLVVIEFLDISTILRFRILLGLLLVPICLYFLPFVTAPISFHKSHFVKKCVTHEAVHPGRDIIPDEFWDLATRTVAELNGFGFKLRGHFRTSHDATGSVAYVSLLENSPDLDIAKLLVHFMQIKGLSQTHSTVVIHSRFLSGSELATANNRVVSHFPRPKNLRSLWLPHVRHAGELYRIHRKAVQGLDLGEKRPILDRDPIEHMNETRKKEIDRWIKLGYYKPDESGDVLWLTWKGAVRSTWMHLWPIKPIRRAWRKHQTNKLLRMLEE